MEGKSELYLFQVDSVGNVIESSNEYRVSIDNQKMIKTAANKILPKAVPNEFY